MDPDQTLYATPSPIALVGLQLPSGGCLSASAMSHTSPATFDVMSTDSGMAGTSDIPAYMRDEYADPDQAPPCLGRESRNDKETWRVKP